MAQISVILLVQNSAKTLGRCLDSLRSFAEVVCIDGGSYDQTPEIIKTYSNTKYFYHPWPGFIAQRNYSLQCASHDWCFMIDSDEACTSELASQMHQLLDQGPSYGMYKIVRTEYFCGQAIEIGHGRSAYQERLFDRRRVSYVGGVHHQHQLDGILVTGNDQRVGAIDRNLRILHDPEYGIDEWLQKFPRFSILVANEKIARGRRVSALETLVTFYGEFFKAYRHSFRAGRVGFIVCLLHALMRAMIKIYIYQNQYYGKDNHLTKISQHLG